jgi:hypothetical protein
MTWEGAEYLRCVVHVVLVSYSWACALDHGTEQGTTDKISYLLTLNASSGALRRNAVHCPEIRKSVVKKAWATFSGRTNFSKKTHQIHGPSQRERAKTHLI